MHEQISSSGLPTYTLSNTNAMAVRHIQHTYPFWSRFTGHVLSYEHGSLKPEKEIYEAFERVSGFSAGSIAYLDDREENIGVAKERGWEAIQYLNPQQALGAFRAWGLPVQN